MARPKKPPEPSESKELVEQKKPAPEPIDPSLISNLVLHGDLKSFTDEQKVAYYNNICTSLGLNPLTRPFQLIILNGKETLYATRDAAEQLRKINGVSVVEMHKENTGELYIVTVKVQDKSGRFEISTGAVNIKNLSGENLANKIMIAETKAKRRATLSICGLGMLDETEVATIPGVVYVNPTLTNELSPAQKEIQEKREYLESLPQAIQDGFRLLGWGIKAAYLYCEQKGMDNHDAILAGINETIDKKAAAENGTKEAVNA